MEVPKIFHGELWARALIVICVSMGLTLSAVLLYIREAVSIEIPPEVEKKAVALEKVHADAERFFASTCSKCHRAPDPTKPGPARDDCTKGLSKESLSKVQTYVSDVKAGKDLYESYCSRCHSLIDPGSHTFDYWSKNLCTSESCMVKRKLNADEEQQVLLYLSAHAKRN